MIQALFSTLQSLFFTFIGITGIGFLVIFHEFGHFIFAKMFGMRVQTFSMGFGPYLTSKKIGDTEFVLSAIPLGGYVDLGSPEGKENDKYSFTARPWYQKALVMLGGIGFNILFAYVAMICLFMAGMPESPALFPDNAIPVVKNLETGSVAEKAGFMLQDTIVAVNGKQVENSVKNLLENMQPLAGQEVKISILRGNEPKELTITLGKRSMLGTIYGTLPGIGYTLLPLAGLSPWESIKRGIQLTNKHIVNTLSAFKYLFSSGDTSNIAGPVMIFSASVKGAAQGFKIFLMFLALISISLAVLNIIPLPILDGGRLLIYTIEAIIGRDLPEKMKEYIFIGTWIALLTLTVFLIGKDIMHLAGNYIESFLKLIHLK